MNHAEGFFATILAALGRFPGQLLERALGAYLAGWGLVAICSPHMFEDAPFAWAYLADRPEWHYGVLFLACGLAQALVSSPGPRVRRRYVASAAGAILSVGLVVALTHTSAWSGVYTYGCIAASELFLLVRLWLLWHFQEQRGVYLANDLAFNAFRAPRP